MKADLSLTDIRQIVRRAWVKVASALVLTDRAEASMLTRLSQCRNV